MRKPNETVEREINKEFTDRETPRELFWKWYNKASENQDDFFVLSFYGMGGIGKSCLVNQLCRELTDRRGVYVKYDFENTVSFEPYYILNGLRQSFRNRYGNLFHFPLLNAALILMAKKSSFTFEDDEIVKSVLEESPHLMNSVNALSLIPAVGGYIQNAIVFTSQLIADIENLKIRKELKEKYKTYIEEMTRLEADELRKKMPLYFWNDMSENVKYLDRPIVIFLDTYEKYVDTFKASSNIIVDSWLRESSQSLIQRIPGILWVISGRECLTWDNQGEWDKIHFLSHELTELEEINCKKYLYEAGITNEELITLIIELSNRVPIYLNLCVDTYYMLIDRGITPTVQNYQVDQHKIANLFIKYLDAVNRDIVCMLAAMTGWYDEEAEYVGRHLSTRMFSIERYRVIIQHSFIKTDESGKRSMHNIVVDALKSEMDEATLDEVNGYLFHFRVNKLDLMNSSSSSVLLINEAVESFCQLSKGNIYDDQYIDFRKLTKRITDFRHSGFINESMIISTKLNDHCALMFSETDYYGESLKIKADAYWSSGDYQQALIHDKQSYQQRRNILGENHPDTLGSIHNIGVDLIDLGKYEESLNILEKVYRTRAQVLGKEHPDTLLTLHSVGVDYGKLGRYKDALEIDTRVYVSRKRVLGENNPDTLRSLHSVGVDYCYIGYNNEMLEVNLQVYKARKQVLGGNHPDTLRSLHNIGVAYFRLGNYEEALKRELQAYENMKHVLGEQHPETLGSLNNVGLIYCSLGKYEKSIKACKKAYEARNRVLGWKHPDTLNSLYNVGVVYNSLHNYKEALIVNQRVYQIRKTELGEEHPDTLSSLYSIGVVYRGLQRYQEALEIDQQVYEARKRLLGEEHPDTQNSLISLSYDYSNIGLHEESLKIKGSIQALSSAGRAQLSGITGPY